MNTHMSHWVEQSLLCYFIALNSEINLALEVVFIEEVWGNKANDVLHPTPLRGIPQMSTLYLPSCSIKSIHQGSDGHEAGNLVFCGLVFFLR